ncbi:peptidase S1 [Brevundimonas sp. 2R-24]|uniref:Peptidase S1 n=1 Tax=Peiella sedimenti TaxID=3061083 RepID=A0ABT8SHE9_9CAUL|nr:peptidase S1 [Caulobacteraceae bacterium XZ-24]
MRTFTAILLAAGLCAGAAAAQDYTGNPTYGTVNLRAGFQPDPYDVSVRSGGGIDATTRFDSCQGWIANAPDVRLNYTAGSSLPLWISAHASADVTLVVNAPDGTWYCDDDSGEGLNPWVAFAKPQSGQYDIWIGTYGRNSIEPATLTISEVMHR